MQLPLNTTPWCCCCRQHPFSPGFILEWAPSLLIPRGGDATPGQESPPGAAEEFISIFIEASPQQSRCTRQHATLRTPFHAGNHGYTHRGRAGLRLPCQWGSPALRGPPVQHWHQCLRACLGAWFHPTQLGTGPNWETLGNGEDQGLKCSSAAWLIPPWSWDSWAEAPGSVVPPGLRTLAPPGGWELAGPLSHAFGSVGAEWSWVPWCRWQASSPWPSEGMSGLEPGRVVLVYHCPTGPEWWPWAPCALQDEAEWSPLGLSCSPLTLPDPRLQAQAQCPPASLALPPPTANHSRDPSAALCPEPSKL